MKLNAILCDACSDSIEPKDVNVITRKSGAALKAAGFPESVDLCPNCAKEFAATFQAMKEDKADEREEGEKAAAKAAKK